MSIRSSPPPCPAASSTSASTTSTHLDARPGRGDRPHHPQPELIAPPRRRYDESRDDRPADVLCRGTGPDQGRPAAPRVRDLRFRRRRPGRADARVRPPGADRRARSRLAVPERDRPARLREAVAGWASRRLDVTLDPETQVIPASGSKEAIFHLPLALFAEQDPRRRIVYPSPSYPVYQGSAQFSGGIPHPYVLTEANAYRLDLATLPADVLAETRIAWLNYPHNPTGASIDLAYLRDQVAIAREHDILLCADDCYLDLYFPNASQPATQRAAGHPVGRAQRRIAVEALGHDGLSQRLHRRRRVGHQAPQAHAAQLRRGFAELRAGRRGRGMGRRCARRRAARASSAPSAS